MAKAVISQSHLIFEKLYHLNFLILSLCAHFLNHSQFLWVFSESCFALEACYEKQNL